MYISGRKQLFSLPLLAQSLPQNNLKWPDPYCTGMVQLLVTKYIDKSELSSVWPLMDFTFPPLRNNLHIAFHHLVLFSAHVMSSLLCPFCSWTIGKCYCLFCGVSKSTFNCLLVFSVCLGTAPSIMHPVVKLVSVSILYVLTVCQKVSEVKPSSSFEHCCQRWSVTFQFFSFLVLNFHNFVAALVNLIMGLYWM